MTIKSEMLFLLRNYVKSFWPSEIKAGMEVINEINEYFKDDIWAKYWWDRVRYKIEERLFKQMNKSKADINEFGGYHFVYHYGYHYSANELSLNEDKLSEKDILKVNAFFASKLKFQLSHSKDALAQIDNEILQKQTHIPAKKDNKYGYINDSNEIMLPFIYDSVSAFKGDYSIVKKNEKYGVINKKGEVIIPFEYEEIEVINDTYAIIQLNKLYGLQYFDKSVNIPCMYQFLASIKNDTIRVRYEEQFGFINLQNKFIIEPTYDDAEDFEDDLAAVSIYEKEWFFIRKDNSRLTKNNFSEVRSFSEGFAAVKVMMVSGARDITINGVVKRINIKSGYWGFIDEAGVERIECIYEDVESFSEGLAAVKIENKWGYIDYTNNFIIEPKFDRVFSFSKGVAVVENDQKYGLINAKENVIIPIKYESIWYTFSEGLVGAKQQNKWGFIDKTNNLVIPFKYEDARQFSHGLAFVYLNNRIGFIDHDGKEFWL